MAAKKVRTVADITAKFESGKVLSKSDCKIILDEIWREYQESHTRNNTLFDVLIANAEKVVEKNNRPLSDNEAKDYYGLANCDNHTAKMSGMESFSTNNRANERCHKNKCIAGSICEHCFADKQMDTFTSMEKPYTISYLLLTYKVLPKSILPVVNRLFARIESFGDVGNGIHAVNYCNLMTANPINSMARFAAWTKNPDLWRFAFKTVGKPDNLSFGVSSLFVNRENKIPANMAEYVDFIFTVYKSEKDAKKDGYTINCGARHCLSCLRCYKARDAKQENGEIVHVIEKQK